jgi:hypothetical protein
MKRTFYFWLAAMVTSVAVSSIAAAQSQQTSLGDYARAVKKAQKPEKASPNVYDNDNLPRTSSVSVVGRSAEPEGDKDQSTDAAKDGDKPDAAELKPGQAADERQKALAAWKSKLDEQRGQISLLSRELDVLKREHDLKASEFYGNPAMRTQNPTGFAAEDEKYKKQIAEQQEKVDAAKAKLGDMQDQARKAGAPSSVTE